MARITVQSYDSDLDDLISVFFLPGSKYTETSFTDELQSLNVPWNQFSWVLCSKLHTGQHALSHPKFIHDSNHTQQNWHLTQN